MEQMSIAEIGRRLVRVGKLRAKPLCIHGADEIVEGWIPSSILDYCLVKAFLMQSLGDFPPVYVGEQALKGCCPGGTMHLGYTEAPGGLRYFLSSGIPTYRGGAAEFLRMSPEMADETRKAMGEIRPVAKNIVFRYCSDLEDSDPGVLGIICFGTAEKIRNIFALDFFSTTNVFGSIIVPSGSACSTLVTYPCGMASNAPKDVMFAGPADPTVNKFMPADYMAVGIPISVARRMCEHIDESFIAKRPQVVFPEKREQLE